MTLRRGDAQSVPAPGSSQFLFYQSEDGRTRLQVRLEGETVWLTQADMAALFQTTFQNITLHIRSIYREGELEPGPTCKDYLQVRQEGSRQIRRKLKHYSLDMILAAGYRVRSPRGTQFRQWATERLREYVVKGFTLDDERLKQAGGGSYFDELLARIRDGRPEGAFQSVQLANGRGPVPYVSVVAKGMASGMPYACPRGAARPCQKRLPNARMGRPARGFPDPLREGQELAGLVKIPERVPGARNRPFLFPRCGPAAPPTFGSVGRTNKCKRLHVHGQGEHELFASVVWISLTQPRQEAPAMLCDADLASHRFLPKANRHFCRSIFD